MDLFESTFPPRKIRFRVSALVLLVALLACGDDNAPDGAEELGTPTETVVSAFNRHLTVNWNEIPGATSYKIAIRRKNGFVPPKWREYTVPAAPYTIADRWALSGMEYEVRVAAVHAHGQSEWSPPVSITAPVLQAAPADAISITAPTAEGDPIAVSLHSQRPYKNKSRWNYSICNADGSGCKLLPRAWAWAWDSARLSRLHWMDRMGDKMQGKHLSVQVDYDKEGVSYSATAVLELADAAPAPAAFVPELAAGCPPVRPDIGADGLTADATHKTHLYALQSASVGLRWDSARDGAIARDYALGGAIAPLCNDLLVATTHGQLALVRPTGEVAYLKGNVPMNKAELLAHPDKANFHLLWFRVADILLKWHSAGRYELFVTHHYFTGECLRFRLSATTLLQQGADVSVSPEWRTIFDAEPCLPTIPGMRGGEEAGGKMLMDGPDHLLVVIGTHNQNEYAQDPASHLGKLVRVEIETGHTEVLAFGLRNPQGLAWDRDGNLWETEHGPQGGDELNLLEPGGNYGWPWVTYGVGYGSWVNVSRIEKLGRHDGFAKPVFAWVPAIGISSLIVNDERLFPLWKDDLLIGALSGWDKAHSLYRVRRDGTDVQYVERIKVGYRVRDLAQMPDRRIALLADRGRVHFLSRSYAGCDDELKWLSVYDVDCGERRP